MADNNALVLLARYVNYCSNACKFLTFFEFVNQHLARVRNFLFVVQEDFLAYNLLNEKALRTVGEFVLIEVGRIFGQQFLNLLENLGRVELVQRRNGINVGVGQHIAPHLNLCLKFGLVAQVYLVDKQDNRDIFLANLLKILAVLVECLDHICHIHNNIGIDQRCIDKLQHCFLQLVVRLQNARRVRVNHLKIVAIDNAHYAVARGLRLVGDNGQPLAHKGVHQRRFADIRVADNIYKTCFMCHRLKICGKDRKSIRFKMLYLFYIKCGKPNLCKKHSRDNGLLFCSFCDFLHLLSRNLSIFGQWNGVNIDDVFWLPIFR